MLTYWLMFLLPASAALFARTRRANAVTGERDYRLDGMWWSIVVVLTALIGFRLEVGGDWFNYFNYLFKVRDISLGDTLLLDDPGYHLITWLSVRAGWGVFGLNLMGGAVFAIGLAVFCRSLPRPWLALAVAVPYMVIVVGMGYARQAIALGFAMLGLVALGRKSTAWFVVWVVLGATMHKSAVLLLPIAALASSRNRWWSMAWVGVVALGAYVLFLQESVDALYTNYVEAQYQSQGALIRLVMNALPAAILLGWQRRFDFSEGEAPLWRWFAIISLVLLGVLLLTPASTAVDRVALYMLPLQLVVFSHFPDVFGRRGKRNDLQVAAVVGYYAAVQFVWLNFASHSQYWLPYRFYPLELL